jgi:anti-anti-sigma factor
MTAIFRISSAPPAAWLRIEGELDVVSHAPLAWRLLDLEQLECTHVILDVGDVTHVDRSSLRLIDDARRRLLARGASFEISSASLGFALMARLGGYGPLAEHAASPFPAARLRLLPGARSGPRWQAETSAS